MGSRVSRQIAADINVVSVQGCVWASRMEVLPAIGSARGVCLKNGRYEGIVSYRWLAGTACSSYDWDGWRREVERGNGQ